MINPGTQSPDVRTHKQPQIVLNYESRAKTNVAFLLVGEDERNEMSRRLSEVRSNQAGQSISVRVGREQIMFTGTDYKQRAEVVGSRLRSAAREIEGDELRSITPYVMERPGLSEGDLPSATIIIIGDYGSAPLGDPEVFDAITAGLNGLATRLITEELP